MRRFLCVLAILFVLPAPVFGVDLFGGEIQKAAQGVVRSWKIGDLKSMKKFYKDLVLYETYQVSVGKWSPEESYLSHIPRKEEDLEKIAVSIFILYLQREQGVDLNPRGFFANRQYEIQVQP